MVDLGKVDDQNNPEKRSRVRSLAMPLGLKNIFRDSSFFQLSSLICVGFGGRAEEDGENLTEALIDIIRDYSEASTIQGLNYIFFPYQVKLFLLSF
jgi:hypothetical protein